VPKLKELDYRLDVDSEKAHRSLGLFLRDLDETLDARIQSYRYLWDSQDWRTFMLVFTGTDRLMHFLWDAYQDRGHEYHEAFLNYFRRIDEAIGEICGKIDDDDTLVMLSDHGFERLEKDIYVNRILNGRRSSANSRTVSRVGQHGLRNQSFRIGSCAAMYQTEEQIPRRLCQRRGQRTSHKRPCGFVRPARSRWPQGDQAYLRKEEIYSGSCLDQAADLILLSERASTSRRV